MSDHQVVSNHVNAQAPGIAQAHTIYGEPLTTVRPAGSTDSNIQPAFGTWSTAPFVSENDVITKKIKTARRCQGNDGTCKGFPMKDLDYCPGHARGLGLVQNWNKNGKMTDDEPAAAP